MARTLREAQKITGDGIVPTFSAADAANGEKMVIPNRTAYLEVVNADDDTAVDVSFVIAREVDGELPAPKEVTVAFGTRKKIKFGKEEDYLQADGMYYVDYSTSTGITAGLFYE